MRIEDMDELVMKLESNNITDYKIFALKYSTGITCSSKVIYSDLSFKTKFNMFYIWYLRKCHDEPFVIITSSLKYSTIISDWLVNELKTIGFSSDKVFIYNIKELTKAEGYVAVNFMRSHLFRSIIYIYKYILAL